MKCFYDYFCRERRKTAGFLSFLPTALRNLSANLLIKFVFTKFPLEKTTKARKKRSLSNSGAAPPVRNPRIDEPSTSHAPSEKGEKSDWAIVLFFG